MSFYKLIYNWALKHKEKTMHLSYGRHILIQWLESLIGEKIKNNII